MSVLCSSQANRIQLFLPFYRNIDGELQCINAMNYGLPDTTTWIGGMAQQWTLEHILEGFQGEKDPSAPKEQKVLPKESKAYIRDPKDLIARRGLYNVLKPYREKYTRWQYQFLCHLILSSTHDISIHGDLPGVPIPWNAFTNSLPSMRKRHLDELIQDGLIRRDHYDQANHQCYWYFMEERLAE